MKDNATPELRGALIDLDGTLLDTETAFFRVWCETLSDYGIELAQSTYDIHMRCRHESIISSFSQLWDLNENTSRELLEYVTATVIADLSIQPLDGASEFLAGLHEHGVKTAIVSSSRRARVTSVSATFGWDDHLEAIIAYEDAADHKPHPDPYLRAMKALRLTSKNCVSVEDALPGLHASDAAGLRGFFIGSPLYHIPATQEHLPTWPITAEDFIAAANTLLRAPRI